MFIERKTKTFETGTRLVPFCKECNSQNIETIQTCKDCGSHQITSDWTDIRSQRVEMEKREVLIYKCDKCGKEFEFCNRYNNSNIISYGDGEFCPFERSNDDDYYVGSDLVNYNLGIDLCNECKEEFVNKLNARLSKLVSESNINNLKELFMEDNI